MLKVLLIEDNPADARLFLKMLSEDSASRFDITVKETLKDGLVVLHDEMFDAVFIDLNLPDCMGLGTLHAVLECQETMPVIALTGINDDELGSQAIKDGAQDYLPKDDLTPSGLIRSLRYSVERKKLVLQLYQKAQKAQQEIEELGKITQLVQAPSANHNDSSLISFSSVRVQQLVTQYGRILNKAVSEQIHKTENRHTVLLKELIGQLGSLKARPKDIIKIHLLAIDEVSRSDYEFSESAYFEEGRMLLLESIGELASFYRSCTLGK